MSKGLKETEKIHYYSTNGQAPALTFGEALLQGQAPDKGLYMPDIIPAFTSRELENLRGLTYPDIAYQVLSRFLVNDVPDSILYDLIKDAYDFPVPLEKVFDKTYVMRLDQGPTASFKDFAARMMARLMNFYLSQKQHKLRILTATSGDTGSAIANAFFGLENIEVFILFPINEVSARQRKQMTSLGGNIRVLAVDGKFDDCQALVKQAFSDSDLKHLGLSSANSINIGRLLPQTIYYFYAWSNTGAEYGLTENQLGPDNIDLHNTEGSIVFVVPSGNFGNMMGGMLARKMGLPVKRMVIATNENDEVPHFFETRKYKKIVPSRNCISSAMNVGHPSNLARLIDLYGGKMDETGKIHHRPDFENMVRDIFATAVDDATTRKTIKEAWETYQLLLEPHGAVGWKGLEHYLWEYPEEGGSKKVKIVLETAHPAKFPETIKEILGIDPKLPPALQGIEEAVEEYRSLENSYACFKQYLCEL